MGHGWMDSNKEVCMLTIKILGPGCANCKKLKEVVNQVVGELHIEAKVQNAERRCGWAGRKSARLRSV